METAKGAVKTAKGGSAEGCGLRRREGHRVGSAGAQ